jgi:hypothetical protein
MSTAAQRLDVVPEDWQRALAVVAHPDDLEYGTAAAITRWTRQGTGRRSPRPLVPGQRCFSNQ